MLLRLQKTVSMMLMTTLVMLPLLTRPVQANYLGGAAAISGFQPASQGGGSSTASPQSTDARSGAYQTDTFTGAATYSYPFELPPYRSGLTPQLSLQYSSSNTSTDAIAGYGWSLSWASIHRRQEGGIENLYTTNTFTASIFGMSGDLTPYALTDSVHGEYRLTEENGPYWRLFYNTNNTWTALNQNGTTFTFGSTAVSRQTDPSNASHTYAWNITSVEDTNTGLVTYNYIASGGRVYPYAIGYGPVSVTLSYDTRPDPITHYDTGFPVTTTMRLHSIMVDINSAVSSGEYRLWTLGYVSGDNGIRSLLSTVYESGMSSEGVETELPTVDFGYSDSGSRGFLWAPATYPAQFANNSSLDNGIRVLDVNADGYDDVIRSYIEQYINSPTYSYILNDHVYLNNKNLEWVDNPSYGFPEGLVQYAMNYWSPTEQSAITNLVDINNDGRTDLTEGNNFQYTSAAVYLNDEGIYNDSSAWPGAANLLPHDLQGIDLGRRFVDVNGDGYPDMVRSDENSASPPSWTTETLLNNGSVQNLQSSPLWHAPMAFEWNGGSDGRERGVRFADVNGDGLQDILWAWVDFHDITTLADEEWYANVVYLNNGNGGWNLAPSWNIPQAFVYSRTEDALPPAVAANPQLNVSMPDEGGVDAGVRLIDVNDDGLVDIVKGDGYWQYIESVLQSSMSLSVDYTTHAVYLNNGVDGWDPAPTTNTIPTFTSGWASDTAHRYGDADADGLTDIFATNPDAMGSGIYMNTASPADLLESITTTKDGVISIAYEPASEDGSEMPYTSSVVASVTTDDGFADTQSTSYTYTGGDLVKYDTYKTEFAGFAEVTTTTESGTLVTAYDQGLTDYGKKGRVIRSQVYSSSGPLLKQTDYTWETTTVSIDRHFTRVAQTVQLDYESTSWHRDSAVQYVYDLTTGQVTETHELGEVDAEPSGVESEITTPLSTEEEGLEAYYQLSDGPNDWQPIPPLSTSADASGHGRSLVMYGYLMWAPGYTNSSIVVSNEDEYAEYCGSNGQLNLGSTYTVSAWIKPDNISTLKVIAAKYDSQRSDGQGKSWRLMLNGNQLRWQTSTNTTTIQTLDSANHIPVDTWTHVAAVSDGTTVRLYINGVMDLNIAPAVDPYESVTCFVLGVEKPDENPSNADSYEFSGNIDEVRVYNNRAYTQITDIMDTDLTDDPTTTSIVESVSSITNTLPGDERTTTTTFTVDTPNWIVRPDLTTLFGFENEVVAKSDNTYDSNGNLTSQAQWLNTTNTWITTTYTLNSAGMPTAVTNRRGYASTIQYDTAYTIFPITITNAAGHVSTQTYNYLTGQVTSSTDSNGNTSTNTYDGLGRLLTAAVPHPATAAVTPLTTYTYDDLSFPSSITTTSTINSVTLESRTYMDGFGRTVQSWQANEGPGQTVTDIWYNDQGLVSESTLPYTSTAAAWSGRDTSQPSVTTLYDTLGRSVAVTSSVGTTITNYQITPYGDFVVATTDPNGHLQEFGYDAYSHMTTVDEHLGPNEYTTFYSYNALDQMHQKLDVYGNVQHTTRDSLGRVVSQSTLHVPGDPGVGIWTYQYDANGNMLQRTDPSSRTTAWTYDALDRNITEDWFNNAAPDITTTYDTAPNGVGRLAQVSMDGVTTSFAYDAQGNTTQETRVIGTDTYVTAWQYDLGGRVTHMTYPENAMVVDYTYNDAGMIETITKDETETIIDNLDYAPTGQANVIEYGNGVVTTHTFDPLENYRLTSTVTTGTYENNPDADGDGLNFAQEQLYGTDPNDPDTDGDTLNDYAEVFTYGTNPTLSDTDSDGFTDPIELTQATNPLAVDTTVYNANTNSFPVTYNTVDNVALNKPVESLIVENPTYSIALGYEADNLTDGNIASLAYPAFQQFDYVIDLQGEHPLETILLGWLSYGFGEDNDPTTTTFITSWELTGTLANGDEVVLAAEDSPQANYSLVDLGAFLRTQEFEELEIHAWSTVNWIGMFELSAYTPYQDTDSDALTNYQETELYSTDPDLFDTNGDGIPDSLVSRTLTLTPYSPNPTTDTTPTWNGAAEIVPINTTAAVSIVGVEYSVSGDLTVPWTAATPSDGAYDENNEAYTVTLGPLAEGTYTLDVRLVTSIASTYYTTNGLSNSVTVDIDTDNDGLSDEDEIAIYETNPLLSDSDEDGLTDSVEINEFETDPNAWDTDDDGMSDGDEIYVYGTDPLEWNNFTFTDTDGDLLEDEDELANGTDPNLWDTDGNGFPDSVLGVSNALTPYTPDPTTETALSYTGYASITTPFFGPAPSGMYISGIEYQYETGSSVASPWYSATPTDGVWDGPTEDYQFTTAPLEPGTHTIATQVHVTVGAVTFTAAIDGDEVTIDAASGPVAYADPSVDEEAPLWMRLTARAAMASVTGDIQHNTYEYDAAGNITSINDTSITPTEKTTTYTYDDLNRLTGAATTGYAQGDYTTTYQYDLIGNMTYKSDVGTLSYAGTGNPTPHAVTAVNGTPYTYDTNGNLTGDGAHTYTYDIRDRLVSSGDWTFTYDHTGQRVTSTNTSTGDTTQYVNNFVESRPDGMVYYIYAGGERVAQVVDGQTYYYHKDHLQGTALVTNESGVVTHISDYTPYGNTSYTVNYGAEVAYTYGGKEYTEDIGLSYFGARYYNPTIGRFVSMDPVDQPLAAPQSHNEYSYSGNSPLVFVDPSGGGTIYFSDVYPGQYSPGSLTSKIDLIQSWLGPTTKSGESENGTSDTAVRIAVKMQMYAAKIGNAPFGSPLNNYNFRPVQAFHNSAPEYYKSGYHSGVDINYNGGALPTVYATMSGVATGHFQMNNTHTDKIYDSAGNVINSIEHSTSGNEPHGGYDALGFGNYVMIESDNFRIYFGHLSAVLIPTGASINVQYGTPIGIMGTTGFSEGNHLHYEIRWKNSAGQWITVDPSDYGLFHNLNGDALNIEQQWKYDQDP